MASLGMELAAALPAGAFGGPVDQDYLLQARQMQALSLGFHIILVCFGVAFPALVLFVEGLYLRTGDPVYRTLAKRWSKAMLVLFAVGVVSGTILSFELGLLWPRFMAEFGDVFGLAFTLEGFSFFLEAIFIAVYVYGWDRLAPRLHFLSGIPIVLAGILGALFVLSVNGWMNNPTGFDLVDGQVTNVDPLRALFNDNLWPTFVHMLLAAYLVAGFVTAGVYAVAWLRGKRDRYHRIALIVPLTAAALAAPVQLVAGDWAARRVAETQPVKLAAIEGVGRTTDGAPLTVFGWYRSGEVEYGVQIPRLLSLLAYRDPSARVAGLDTVPAADRPPVNIVRLSFQTMVAIGFALTALSLVYLAVWWRRRALPRSRWFYRAVTAAGPLAVIALLAGWITTEVGRQPWIVYQVMRTSEAVTGAGGIPVGYGTLVAVYVLLGAGAIFVLRRMAGRPIEDSSGEPATGVEGWRRRPFGRAGS